jgi:hypothetical protein
MSDLFTPHTFVAGLDVQYCGELAYVALAVQSWEVHIADSYATAGEMPAAYQAGQFAKESLLPYTVAPGRPGGAGLCAWGTAKGCSLFQYEMSLKGGHISNMK